MYQMASGYLSNLIFHMPPTWVFTVYIFGLSGICALIDKFTPMPSNNTNVAIALWALGMICAGTLIGVVLPIMYFEQVLGSQYAHMWLYRVAMGFGGVCGLYIGFRGRVLIAQLTMLGFIGFWVIAFIMWIFGYIKV